MGIRDQKGIRREIGVQRLYTRAIRIKKKRMLRGLDIQNGIPRGIKVLQEWIKGNKRPKTYTKGT